MKTRITISLVVVFLCALMVGCASRTQANVGPIHFGGDVMAHENWDLSFTTGPERTVIGMGLVTVGVDAKWTECTQAFAVSHKTEITKQEKEAAPE